LLAEEVVISKQRVETNRVVVGRVTRETSEPIATDLTQETVDITREQIGRYVDAVPPIRQEEDSFIIPVVEERLVTERRLFLKEEVHVRRRRVRTTHVENVTLRRHEVEVRTLPVTPPNAMGGENSSSSVNRRYEMNYQTVVAAYDTSAHAKVAAEALKAAGFHDTDISIMDKFRAPGRRDWRPGPQPVAAPFRR
jgi:uncharacterized protein (TIGR02271 family)